MVFQNKPNVAQYFLICIVFFLPFLFCLNANAFEVKNLSSRMVQSINYNTSNPNQTYTSVPLITETMIQPVTVSIDGGKVFKISGLTLNFQETFNVKKGQHFDYIINFYLIINNQTLNPSLNESPICPTFTNNGTYAIDECNVTFYNTRTDLSQLIPLSNTSPTTYNVTSIVDGYYQLKLNGHFTSDINNFQSMNAFGPIYSVGNTSPLSLSLTYSLGFSRVRFFDLVGSPEDEAAEKELESTTNIENQTPQNSSGGSSENQQTTNLIGVFSGFLTELNSFSATNCNLDLPFPAFIGGTQTVNICQGKDVLGNFITIVGTLAMLTFYIPLAFVLLKMIYNEIRSFTNG